MKRTQIYTCLVIIGGALHWMSAKAEESFEATSTKPSVEQQGKPRGKMLSFSFREEPLADVITLVAAERGVNIVMPAGADAITSKVTLHMENPLTVDEAWDMLHTILNVAGYSLVLRGSMYAIVKNNKATITKEPVPLYINVPADELPNTDQRIRYLHYLSNIKLTDDATGHGGQSTSEIDTVLQNFLSDTGKYLTDAKTNGILLIDRADVIKSVMKIVGALDQLTFRERLEIIKLRYIDVEMAAQLFEESVLKSDREAQRYGLRDRKPQDEANYFSRQIKVTAEPRTNALVLVGREQAVLRLKEFIEKYIDIPLDSGESILHVYQLQYLDAAELAPVLENIVKSSKSKGAGQSASEQQQSGTERSFEGVVIKTDKPQGGGHDSENAIKYSGGNKLIIAAKSDDWKVIKPIIEELDKPQPTVLIEVLIVDLTAEDARLLGMSVRNPADLPMPKNVDFQTVQVTPQAAIPDTIDNTTNLANNLLGTYTIPASTGSATNFAALAPAGSTLLSFNDKDGSTWGIAQLLQTFVHSKILSHPHVIAINNKEAYIKVGEQRLLQGEAVSAVNPVVKKELKDADLTVTITPRISSSERVSLKVNIDINEWVSGSSNDMITRKMTTIAEVHTGAILALGGLIKVETRSGLNESPIFAKVPILGWLFKRKNVDEVKTNLTVFISPTVIEPRLRGGVSEYTTEHLDIAQRYLTEGELFDSLRDPITRFFFHEEGMNNKKIVASFTEREEFKIGKVEAAYGHEAGDIEYQEKQKHNKKRDIKRKKKNKLSKQQPLNDQVQLASQAKVSPKPQAEADKDTKLKQLLRDVENPLLRA